MNAPALRAGAAVSNLTPPLGVSLDGTISQNGPATHVHDELAARCLVLDDGSTQLAFVVCDCTMIARSILDAARQQAHGHLGRLPPDHILMSATHTHSTPRLIGIGRDEVDLFYLEFVVSRIADGLRRAVNNLEPAKVGFGSVAKPEYIFNRRWQMKPGTIPPNPFGRADEVQMNPPAGSPNLVAPAGPVDPEVAFLSVQRADGTPLAVLANYGLHYAGGTPRGDVSADYFGLFAERLKQLLGAEKADPPFVGIMSNGTSGDVNAINFREKPVKRPPYARMREVADGVATAVAAACKKVEHSAAVTLDARADTLELGVRVPGKDEVRWAEGVLAKGSGKDALTRPEIYARETLLMKDWKPRIEVMVQALRVGPLGIGALPCEVFAETGLAIKKQSPLKPTFTIELANGYGGYLPTPAQHRLGGYETWRARSSFLEVDAETKLRARVLEMLADLARSKDR